MNLLTFLFNYKRIYLNQELIISYRKLVHPPSLMSGYLDFDEVAKRYYQSAKKLKLSSLITQLPVKDLHYLLSQHKSSLILNRRGTVLDVGCGTGSYSLFFKSTRSPFHSYSYLGCEIDERLTSICRQLYPEYKFFTAKAESLPLANTSCSIVFCSGMLHYTLKNWKNALHEMTRVAKDHLIITRLPITKYHQSFYVEQTVHSSYGLEKHYFRIFNRNEIENQLTKLGWRVIACDYSSEDYLINGISEKIILNNYLIGK